MKKFQIAFISAFSLSFLLSCDHFFLFSCCGRRDMEMWNVTVTVNNMSDHDVRDIWVSGLEPYISKLERGNKKTFTFEWEEFKNTTIGRRIDIQYKINGEQFDVKHQEDAVWFKRLPVGHWEWEEDGVKYILTLAGDPYHEENDGFYISLQHFSNGAKIYIFIYNKSYRIEGGEFHRIRISVLLPPCLRDYFPESYFEVYRPPIR